MIILCVMLFVAAIFDYRYRKIPNWLNLLIFITGLAIMIYDSGSADVGRVFVILIILMLFLFPFYQIGGLGAGDIKLFMACVPFISFSEYLHFLFFSLLVAVGISLIKKLIKKKDAMSNRVCMAGAVFVSAILHMGGVF